MPQNVGRQVTLLETLIVLQKSKHIIIGKFKNSFFVQIYLQVEVSHRHVASPSSEKNEFNSTTLHLKLAIFAPLVLY